MKRLLLSCLLLSAVPAVRAQLLPVPGAKNPAWRLLHAKPPMVPMKGTDRMPAPKGISGAGSYRYYWDSDHQLRYEWDSRPNSYAPADSVTVHDDASGTTYSYCRQTPSPKPRQWRRLD